MNRYFEWLCDKIELDTKHTEYTLLITKLYRTPYSIITGLEADGIRIRKAAELREEYGDGIHPEIPVSCLEIMVSIALDAENMIMKDSKYGDRTAQWFWTMVENLGLLPYTDDNFKTYDVEDILGRFVNRHYRKNGIGSIAFSHKSKKDFRKLDIWQQFNIYLTERYVCA